MVRVKRLNHKELQTPWYQTLCGISIAHMSGAPRRSKPTLTLRKVFARNVRLVRIHAGKSQERLADEAGLDRTFVGTLERGIRNISIDNVELLAGALGLPAHELMDPNLPEQRGLDVTLTRAPRIARPYPATTRRPKRTG